MSKQRQANLAIPDLKGITVVQSNRVTNAKRDYSLIQERVFTFLMYNLQTEINQVMNGTSVTQLNIFRDIPSDVLAMNIPLGNIGAPSQYRDIRDAILKMSGIQIQIKTADKALLKWGGIFSSVSMPSNEGGKRSGAFVTIEIRRDVAQQLIDVHYKDGVAQQYTKYMLHVAMECKYKYTSNIYKLLCSYRSRRVYSCTVDELREHLALPPNMYPNFNDLKRFILDPVAAELKSLADLYYDTGDHDFTVRSGRKVVKLNFTIKYPVTEALYDREKTKFIRELMKTFGCTARHIDQIVPYLTPATNWYNLEAVVDRCYYLCSKRMVDHPAAHITRSVIEELEKSLPV